MSRTLITLTALTALLIAACGGDDGPAELNVAWSFASGDCASLGVQTVRISWGQQGQPPRDVDFACTAGGGTLGQLAPEGGTYTIGAVGLDAAGVTRAESFGTTLNVGPGGTGGTPVDVTLRPAASDVQVTWTVGGAGGCPFDVVLPYFITVYKAPAAGGMLTEEVQEIQESCASGQATLMRVPPGDYIIELDSRAQQPAIRGTQPVTVRPGEPAQVSFNL